MAAPSCYGFLRSMCECCVWCAVKDCILLCVSVSMPLLKPSVPCLAGITGDKKAQRGGATPLLSELSAVPALGLD